MATGLKSTPAQRIKRVIEESGMNVTAFARHIGLFRGANLYQILKGKNGISINLAEKIHAKYPNYSVGWLVSGETTNSEGKVVFLPFYQNFETMSFPPVLSTDDKLAISVKYAQNAQIAVAYADDLLNPYLRNSVLLLREIATDEPICYGNIYLVVTDNLRLFRYVYKNRNRSSELRLTTSERLLANDVVILKEHVRSMWLVCGAVCRMVR